VLCLLLGIEQLHTEIASHDHHAIPGALETIEILSEQSQVVSRILNDVLSMQKIEDGALSLEMDIFNLDKMIRSSLFSFRSPCAEKQLKVRINLQSLDAYMDKLFPTFKLGKILENENNETQESHRRPSISNILCNQAHVRGDPYRLRQVLANFVR
jgi:signal transduction histidine kinase